jgi:hypothetical protein
MQGNASDLVAPGAVFGVKKTRVFAAQRHEVPNVSCGARAQIPHPHREGI